MVTIRHLCNEFKLSRSTLLYYDSIGLLKPSGRSESKYRLYSEEDRNRLSKICTFREAGIPLEQMKQLLDHEHPMETEILTEKLQDLNREIHDLRFRQKLIIELLKKNNLPEQKLLLDQEIFSEVLNSMGFDEKNREDFHRQFEQSAPQSHQFFLELLCMEEEEIRRLRGSLQ